MGVSSFMRYFQIRPSRQVLNSTLYNINKEYSAIDFNTPESNVRAEIEKETDLRRYYVAAVTKKWIAVIVLGFFIGILGTVVALVIEEMFIIKNDILRNTLQNGIIGSSLLWTFWTVFPILVCTFIVVEGMTMLKGCGIASISAYLNGVKIHNFHRATTLATLYLSIFLISAANMPGGREELIIQLGAICGAFITRMKIPFTKFRPFLSVSNRSDMRTLVAAGTAAGVSAAFGTPIGAVLFCLEECVSYWCSELTCMMFLCAVCSNFVLHLGYSVYRSGTDFSYNLMPYLFFSGVNEITLTFKFSEVPLFIIMGVFGGLLGTLWNLGQILLRKFRNKYINTKIKRMLEVVVFGICLSLCSISAFHYFGAECTPEFLKSDREGNSSLMKVYCKNDEFESVGIYLFQDLRHTILSLFLVNTELFSFSVVLFGCLYYFVFSELQLGTYLPTGILVPHLICGASWGYLVGIWYSQASEGNVIVAKYAFLGALAQGSGVVRLTLSLGIIMIESFGQQMYALPIFIVVITAKWFGGLFSRSMYRIEAFLEGYPILHATFLPVSTPYKAKHVMVFPLESVKPPVTVQGLVNALLTKHQFFPVLKDGKVIGIITKYQIAVILKSKIYQYPHNTEKMHLMHEMIMEYEGESFVELEGVIHSDHSIPDADSEVDLTNLMSTSTYLINSETSLRKIYSMFVALGLSYVIVVDDEFKAQGIITRKDIACFRKLSQFMLMRTEVLPLKQWSTTAHLKNRKEDK